MRRVFLSLFSVTFLLTNVVAQTPLERASSHILNTAETYGLSAEDLSDMVLNSHHVSRLSGTTHAYFRQAVQGIQVYQGTIHISIDQNLSPISYHNQAIAGAHSLINTTLPVLGPSEAIHTAIEAFEFPEAEEIFLINGPEGTDQAARYMASGYEEEIPIHLVYFQREEGSLRLCWELTILSPFGDHWWDARIDAVDGSVIDQFDYVLKCQFGHNHAHEEPDHADDLSLYLASPMGIEASNSYHVFAEPVESPSHGSRSIKTAPWNVTASPYGWHDTDGSSGAEYTITRGNNVLAQEDANGNNGSGYSPDGGATLDFDFPLNLNQNPSNYRDVAITNLFYWNNYIHDIMYLHGFDEASGNFQQNNYGNGGSGGDYVLADAQDGSGLNNANFATPTDGFKPRMQMFLWSAGTFSTNLTVNSPGGLAGSYTAIEAAFGPKPPTTPITADLVLVNDGTASPSEGCNALINSSSVSGKIALIDRGSCTFVSKVLNAQTAGALACVVCNNVGGGPITMGGTSSSISIPSVMISQADCALLKAQLGSGVNVSLSGIGNPYNIDGDFDNGIIAHEYGHGISIRLTGGASNSGCLNNAEQMGEGWSDFYGLLLTMQASDLATTPRGIGTFAIGQPTTGAGIRPAPYTTDMSVNPYTYSDVSNVSSISQPHGIGFLWCTMLWELTWNLIATEGFDPDLVNGSGGNKTALQLVNEALMLQPCSPGFVDGRDAILAADAALFGGAHACEIWQAFSKRGLGVSANQGSSNSRFDGIEAYDLPPSACTVFPVEWISFTAAPQSTSIQLSWIVGQQTENQEFIVEKTIAGSSEFKEIARISASDKSSSLQHYQHHDSNVSPGNRYLYRIKQLDSDGTYSYSNVVEAQLAAEDLLAVRMYPNPTEDHLTLEYSDLPGSVVETTILNGIGQVVHSEQSSGDHPSHTIDLSHLVTGVYLVTVASGGKRFTQYLVIE